MPFTNPLDALRHHVSGAVARGEATPIAAMPTVESIEASRRADFKACPILEDYIATMLEDLQFREADQACEEEREQVDTGTIYDLTESTYAKCKADCEAFYRDQFLNINAALDLTPGEEGMRYGKTPFTFGRVGYYFYMTRVGAGVSFTDDGTPGEAACLSELDAAARAFRSFDAYIGDDGEVYI